MVLCLALVASVSQSRADTITDTELGFTLKLSSEFVPRPDLVGVTPDVVHAFQFGEAAEDEIAVLLFIEKLGGVIGRERLRKEDFPPGYTGELFVTRWQGFEVDGFEIPKNVDGIDTVTYNVQIPLKREAIQLKLCGPAAQEKALRTLLRQVLDRLNGESNWLSSVAPPTIADSENYGTVLLVLGIGGAIAGFVVLWLVSKRSPKGTVLVIAVVLYVASWQIGDSRLREMRLLCGVMRMLGFAGGILGVIDLLRTREPKATIKQDSPPGPDKPRR
jgi:hypothetical protein